MEIQMPFLLIILAALAMNGSSQIDTISHRKVNWGYGCGGNCAVNTSGQSETALGDVPPNVQLEDHGTLNQKQSDPGGIMIITTLWKYKFHGTSTAGAGRREYDLHTDISECTRTQETLDAGKATTKKQTACTGPPKKWTLVCERKGVPVKGEPRPAWVCSPAGHMDNFGTEFPWVFGIEGPITTVVSGEPHPTTTYESSTPHDPHD